MELILRIIKVGLVVGVLLTLSVGTQDAAKSESEDYETPSNRLVCGSCPEGYAKTGVTNAPEVCKDGDPTLVQCVPLGGRLLAVCGSCPDGYSTVGTSMVPSRCGSEDSGLMSQCQREE